MSTILVVEDHELTRKTLNRRLSKAGHSVLEAVNGNSGIEMLQSNSVDLVLMDFMMKNMNGMQTFQRMREVKPETPCAMITAYAHSGLIKQFIAEGGADFMVKPIGEDFERRVDAILTKTDS
jgi:CheY-like chemotaxis protein